LAGLLSTGQSSGFSLSASSIRDSRLQTLAGLLMAFDATDVNVSHSHLAPA
jgi:hypothetical protein